MRELQLVDFVQIGTANPNLYRRPILAARGKDCRQLRGRDLGRNEDWDSSQKQQGQSAGMQRTTV
jgi:hypothetical protein